MMPSQQRDDHILTRALDAVFPPVCPGCGRRGHWVCERCRPTVARIDQPVCDRCGAPRPGLCRCAELPEPIVAIRSAMPFEGWVREAIHRLKYEGERSRARHLGDLLLPLLGAGDGIDVVVPVPLHPRRARERGFNQAGLLGTRLGWHCGGTPVVDIARTGSVIPQVGLDAEARRHNVIGAFQVPRPELLSGRHVVMVDDVITTSATMVACATAVVEAGAATVLCLSVARAM